jgi:hypothetical protein
VKLVRWKPYTLWCSTSTLPCNTFSRWKIWCTTESNALIQVHFYFTSSNLYVYRELAKKFKFKNSGDIYNHESIIYKVQMPSLNQITIKCCIWQHYDYYIMIIHLPNKAKHMHQYLNLKKVLFSSVFTCHFRVIVCHSWHTATCWLPLSYTTVQFMSYYLPLPIVLMVRIPWLSQSVTTWTQTLPHVI